MVIKTVFHWRELGRCLFVCMVVVPMVAAALMLLVQKFVAVPIWAAVAAGIATGIISTQVYKAVSPPLWHFERREVKQ